MQIQSHAHIHKQEKMAPSELINDFYLLLFKDKNSLEIENKTFSKN